MANIKREIYEVHIGYVNEAGYHVSDPELSGETYPKVVDSKNNDNNVDLAFRKAMGYLGGAERALALRTDDQVDYCYIIRASDGLQIEKRKFGKLADIIVPDPEPEPEPEPEPGPEPEQNGGE